jgi:hypothetical protein
MFNLSARKVIRGETISKQPRVDGAEAELLLAELRHFKDTMSQDRIERVIGRAYDAAFVDECLATYAVPRLLKQRGYPFDIRVAPSAELERALKALWDAAPEKIIWRGRA